MRLILLGSPGAGKGTQASAITKAFSIPQISTGDMLRQAIKNGSELGLMVKKTMDEGRLVSDDTMIALVKARIAEPDCQKGFILDGFPRTIPQAQALIDNHIAFDFVIEIRVPEEVLISRLSGRRVHPASGRTYHLEYNPPKQANIDDVTNEPLIQRPDDNEATVKHRLSVYHQQTEPLIRFYQTLAESDPEAPQYICIDGVGDVDEITQEILTNLTTHFNP